MSMQIYKEKICLKSKITYVFMFFYILSALLMKYSIILRLSSLFVNNAALNLCLDSLRYANSLFSM